MAVTPAFQKEKVRHREDTGTPAPPRACLRNNHKPFWPPKAPGMPPYACRDLHEWEVVPIPTLPGAGGGSFRELLPYGLGGGLGCSPTCPRVAVLRVTPPHHPSAIFALVGFLMPQETGKSPQGPLGSGPGTRKFLLLQRRKLERSGWPRWHWACGQLVWDQEVPASSEKEAGTVRLAQVALGMGAQQCLEEPRFLSLPD